MAANPFDTVPHSSRGSNPFDSGHPHGGNPFDTPANSPRHASPRSSSGGNSFGQTLEQVGRNALSGLNYAAQSPLGHGVLSLLGTTERLSAGTLTGGASGAAHGVVDPEGETDRLHQIERKRDSALAGWLGDHYRPDLNTHHGDAVDHVVQALDDFFTGTGIDLATYIPGLDVVSVGRRAARLAKLGERAAAVGGTGARVAGHVVNRVAPHVPAPIRQGVAATFNDARDAAQHLATVARNSLSTSALPRQGVTQQGLNQVRALEGQGHHLRHTLTQQFHGAHAPHADTLQSLSLLPPEMRRQYVPPEIDQQLDRIAYLRGTKDVQAAALRNAYSKPNGYRPSPEDVELAKNPLNILTTYDPHYVPTQDIRPELDREGRPTIIRKSKGTSTRSNQAANRNITGADFSVQVKQALENAAGEISRAHTQRNVIDRLGLGPAPDFAHVDAQIAHAAQSGDAAKVARFTKLKQVLYQRYSDQLARRGEMIEPGAELTTRNLNTEYSGPYGSLEDYQRRAGNQLAQLGQGVGAAYDKSGKLLSKAKLAPLSSRVNANLASAALATRVASRARQAAQDVAAAAQTYGNAAAGRVGRATDAAEGKLGNAAQARATRLQRIEKVVQDRAARATGGSVRRDIGNGGGFGLPGEAPITAKGTQGTRESLSISKPVFDETTRSITEAGRVPGSLDPIRAAASARNTRSIAKPANRAAQVAASAQKVQLRRLASAAKAKMAANDRNAALAALNERVKAMREREGTVQLPKVLDDRLFGESVAPPENILGAAGGALANVMFTNPLPHGLGNVAQQQLFAGHGPGALFEGLKNAVKGGPQAEADIEAAKRAGAVSTRGYHSDEPVSNPLGAVNNAVQKSLTKFHDAQAAEAFKREKAKGLSDADAAEEVRRIFGRPYEHSETAKALGNVGAKFANFGLATVPRSAKKMLESPEGLRRLKQFALATNSANEDYFEPEYGVDLNPGGFAERAASLAFRPANYLGSRSLETSLSSELGQERYGLKDMAKTVLPYGELLDLASQPLTDKQREAGAYKELPNWLKLLGITGAYFTHAETPEHKIRRELWREGL